MANPLKDTEQSASLNHSRDDDFRNMIENSLDLIIKVNLTGHYTYVNPAFCALYATKSEDLLGRHYSDDVLEDDRVMVDEFFNKLFDPPYIVRFTHREKTAHGIRYLEWTGKGITNADGELVEFVGIARDVTDRLDLIERLSQQAYHDELTGLANRRFLSQQAHLELERARRYQYPLAIFMLDIDHFKNINDQYGHLAGDHALQQLSQLMKDTLREHDMIARVGGEEFAVLLPEADLAAAIVIAERLRATVATFCFRVLQTLDISLTVSIGVASTSDVAHDFEKLLHEADNRLYQAKAADRNRVIPQII